MTKTVTGAGSVEYFSGTDIGRIRWADCRTATLVCRACGTSAAMPHSVTTPNTVHGKSDVDFYRCPACGSLNAVVENFTDYDEDGSFSETPAFVRHYLQVGAGIDFMIRPLQQSRPAPGASMIDVGCGFGYTVDFWNWAQGGNGVGVEPSLYGRLGQRLLGAPITTDYLSNLPELNSRRYARVFSSEVIEHVDDTAAFIAELKGVLASSGMLILTTPNADFVDPAHSPSIVVAALSPGLHRVLFSRAALERALKGGGFANVEVRAVAERLVAYASDAALSLHADPAAERRQYAAYLRAAMEKPRDADVTMGFLFRYFEDQVNAGDLAAAAPAWARLREMVQTGYGLDLVNLAAVRARDAEVIRFEDYVDRLPLFLSAALYYAAMGTLNGANFLPEAKAGFLAAAETAARAFAVAPNFAQKAASIYWWARLHAAIAAIREDDHATAQFELQALIDARSDPATRLRPEPDQLLRAKRELGVSFLQSGQPERAMGLLREVLHEGGEAARHDAGALYRTALAQAVAEVHDVLPDLSHSKRQRKLFG